MRTRGALMGLACVLAGLFPAVPGVALATGGSYVSMTPVRILDTRASHQTLGPGAVLTVPVAGVPSGSTAVVMNVTAVNATGSSYLTVWPAGVAMPTASSLNFAAGQTVANLVAVPLPASGQVSVYNLTGSVDVLFDVAGYVGTAAKPAAGLFNSVAPYRLLDTRGGAGPLAAGAVYKLQVSGQGGLPATGVDSVVLNVTAVSPTAPGYVTVYPDGSPQPTASNLNFTAGETVPNRVLVKLGPTGAVDLYNFAGATQLVVDLNGWFGDGTLQTSGGPFSALTAPTRILDSRSGLGVPQQPIGPQGAFALQVAGAAGVPSTGVAAVVANLTVTNTTAPSYLTAWADGTGRPTASDLNYAGGQTVANLVVVPLGSTGKIDLYNNGGCTDVVLDVVGFFSGQPLAGTAATPAVVACPPPPPPPPANAPEWLNHLNDYRAVVGLPPATENPTFSSADCLHATYISETGQAGHTEDPSNPYYTAAGAAAGESSNVAWNTDPGVSDDYFIDWWMAAPFHALGIVRPGLQTTGYCAHHDAGRFQWASAAALNVLSGLSYQQVTSPLYFPGGGTTIGIGSYHGGEVPDPLTSCPGFSAPTGLPVFVQLPAAVASVSGHAFLDGASVLPSCEESGADYVNPDANSQLLGRALLGNVVVVIPQQPLTSGHTYTVVIDSDGQHYSWSFTEG